MIQPSNIHSEARIGSRATPGFALVITLLLMILLTVVAVGLLSLSSITLRATSQGSASATARANARLAMHLAISELQKTMGPDQRISAPADSLAVSPSVVDASWKHATAVLKRTEDALLPSDETPADKMKREFQGWLVSGDPAITSVIGSASTAVPGGLLLMKGNSSAEDVRVAGVSVTTAAGKGRYAWWIEDLGTKASMGLAKQSDAALAVLAPDRFDIRKIAGLENAPDKDASEWTRLLSSATAELMIANSQSVLRMAGRPVTALHRGVLADIKRGRLKRDLTSALAEDKPGMESLLGRQIYEPVSPTGLDPGGPHWEQIRQYYQSGQGGALTVRRQTADQAGYYPVIAGMTEIYGISNTEGYAPAYTLPGLDANFYNRPGPPAAKVMAFHMTPVVKLWNPYDRPLNAPAGYTLAVGNGNSQHTGSDLSYQDQIGWGRNGGVVVSVRPPKTMRYEHRYFIPPVTIAPGETKIFSLNANSFLDIDGSYTPFNVGKNFGTKTNVKANGWILGELADVSESGGFSGYSFWDLNFTKQTAIPLADREKWNWTGGRSEQQIATGGDIQILDTNNDAGLQFRVIPQPFMTWNIRLFAGKQVRPPLNAGGTAYEAEPEVPLVNIRNVNTNTTGFSKGSIPITTNADPAMEPFFLSPSGQASMWARRFVLKLASNEGDEKPALYNPQNGRTKDAKWLANFNPRSPTVGCWGTEHARPDSIASFTSPPAALRVNGTRNASPFGMGTPGNLLSGMLSSFTSQDALFLNKAIGHSDIAGPERAVLFQTPQAGAPEKYFFSIGQLTHANLWIEDGPYEVDTKTKRHATEDWFADNMHPAYPIGNSYADPRLKLSENQGLFKNVTIVDQAISYQSTFHDLSYYLNRSLWDSYFFSARKAEPGASGSYNSRLEMLRPVALKAGADGFNNNSSKMLLAGAFNINSTDVLAWTAFLSSMCDVNINGAGRTANASYPRTLPPLDGEVSDTTASDSASQYTGFRSLKESEVADLAARIVEQIKVRGPATSLADFVNRSPSAGSPIEHRVKGLLQTAIDATQINEKHRATRIEESRVEKNYEPKSFAGDIAAAAPGYLTQADLLARLGHLMSPRSDTFIIRCRGEALDKAGNVIASAVCEATVQRLPSYVDPAIDPAMEFNSLPVNSPTRIFGRAFSLTAFRWLNSQEI